MEQSGAREIPGDRIMCQVRKNTDRSYGGTTATAAAVTAKPPRTTSYLERTAAAAYLSSPFFAVQPCTWTPLLSPPPIYKSSYVYVVRYIVVIYRRSPT